MPISDNKNKTNAKKAINDSSKSGISKKVKKYFQEYKMVLRNLSK